MAPLTGPKIQCRPWCAQKEIFMATHSHDFNPESSSGPPAGAASNERFEGEIPANFSPDQPGAAAAETAVPRDWRDPNLRPLSLGGPAPGGKYEAVTSSEAQTEIRLTKKLRW
jgi:hypothetical protein